MGGFGSAVLELLSAKGIRVPTRVLAVPDRVFEQASQARLREMAGLTPADIAAAAQELLREAHGPGKRATQASAASRVSV
jgi:1-deoxy-D-xylulose-5-phosphate synthase